MKTQSKTHNPNPKICSRGSYMKFTAIQAYLRSKKISNEQPNLTTKAKRER